MNLTTNGSTLPHSTFSTHPQEAMLRHIERMRDDDKQEALKKKEAAKRLMEDVALANAEQIRLKNRQREVEQV